MVGYKCEVCNYITMRKSDFNRHLKTKKHTMLEDNYDLEEEKKHIFPHKSSQILTIPHKMCENSSQILTKSSQILTNPHKILTKSSQIEKKTYICNFCNKVFKRSDNLNRHIQKYCKHKKEIEENEECLMLQIEEHKAEKDKLYKYIDKYK